MNTEDNIEQFARSKQTQERFAEVLARVLPEWTRLVWGKPSVCKTFFRRWQAAGFNITPNHYYSPIPDLNTLKQSDLERKSNLIGINLDEPGQLALLDCFAQRYQSEYVAFNAERSNLDGKFFFGNGTFEHVDAEVLYAMIRHFKPKRMIEIGSGWSTLVSAAACWKNQLDQNPCRFTAIEPYPSDLFQKPISGLTELIKLKLEDVPLSVFTELGHNDILFIDSTHVIKCGNDVEREYFEILPRLKPGVIVHVHDIFLPLRYPANWLTQEMIFWNEQYLLEALLMYSTGFQVLWAGCHMHLQYPGRLAAAFPGYVPEKALPGSFWMRKVAK